METYYRTYPQVNGSTKHDSNIIVSGKGGVIVVYSYSHICSAVCNVGMLKDRASLYSWLKEMSVLSCA